MTTAEIKFDLVDAFVPLSDESGEDGGADGTDDDDLNDDSDDASEGGESDGYGNEDDSESA